jgi:8-hydroxy-5-deazaflavin:NADPH oxidoreductase
MTTIGLIGAGHVGSQLARLAVAHGYEVVVSNSRGPETLTDLVDELGERARAATPAEAAAAGDLVIVAMPLSQIHSLPFDELTGKVVVDTSNYYPEFDGEIGVLDAETTTVSEMLQALLPQSHVVKAFSHINAGDLTTDPEPADSPTRRAITVAGDDPSARDRVAALINEFGFDAVDLGMLEEGWRVQRDTPAYGVRLDVVELRDALAAAKRYRDM